MALSRMVEEDGGAVGEATQVVFQPRAVLTTSKWLVAPLNRKCGPSVIFKLPEREPVTLLLTVVSEAEGGKTLDDLLADSLDTLVVHKPLKDTDGRCGGQHPKTGCC